MSGNNGEERGRWSNKSEFLFACLGYAIGLGNLWRFPYLCYRNGGGSFLLPYFVMLVLCGIPLLYMELSVGQSVGFGPVKSIGKMCPLLKGTGIAMVIISFILCTYYNVLIAWGMHYFFDSFKETLPWTYCHFNTTRCEDVFTQMEQNETLPIIKEYTITPSQEYFNHVVLKISNGLDDMGSINTKMLGYLFLAWVVCFFCLFKGVKIIGKVAYFTVLLPYLVLFILLGGTLRLPGSHEGVKFYIIPDWTKLGDASVWLDAAAQIFNSIGIAFGSMIAFASYNDKRNNILVDTLCISLANSFTSIIAGFIVFAALGNMAFRLGTTVDKVVIGGPELVFVAFSNIFTQLPIPQFWSAIFFFMIICLGIDSQFAMVEVVNTSLKDWSMNYPKLKRVRPWFTLIVCCVCFLLGIPNIMEGGIYYLTLLDYYTAIISLMFIAFFEVLATWLIFGPKKLRLLTQTVTGQNPPQIYMFNCWIFTLRYPCAFVTAALLFCILINSIIQYQPLTYGDYIYPIWADFIGWMITFCSILCIPTVAMYTLIKMQLKDILVPFKQILKKSISPDLGYLVPQTGSNEMKPLLKPGSNYADCDNITEESDESPPPQYVDVVSSENPDITDV